MNILKFLNFCPSLYQIAIEGAKRSSVAVPSITSNESVMVSLNLATREIETDETFECLPHEQSK